MQWTVRCEISPPNVVLREDHADEIISALEGHAPAVSYSPHTMSVRFCVDADTSKRALQAGFQIISSALKEAGIKAPEASIVGFEAQTLSDLDRSLQESNVPDVVGVAELAKLLKVSKQRASELARKRDFPKPFVILESGPVWRKSTLVYHLKRWRRLPGRPKGKTRRELVKVS
ncbi:MAG: hypothetical protein ACE10F_05020 [Candidatus Methylomirabilales bacterium]|nr:hypothetical protein [candidate division NC10 bacterium]